MKKMICMLLTILLLASLGSAAFAEENVLDIDIMGICMNGPEVLSELQGVFSPNPNGIIAHDPDVYYMSLDYYAMTEDQLNELLNKPEEEITEEDINAFFAANRPIGVVLACEGGFENALSVFGLDEIPEGMDLVELAVADTLHFYYLASDEASADDLDAPYAEEFRMLQEKVFEALKSAKFYTPVDPAGELVGQTVRFETTDLEGNPVSSSDLFSANKITMINYWGTWCTWCVRELPELAEIHSRLQAKGCGIVGILQDGEDPDKVELAKILVKENGIGYPNVLLSDDMDFLEQVSSFPTSFFVDQEGKILCYPISGAAVDQYEETVNKLLSGESTGGLTVPVSTANDVGAYRITVADSSGDPVKGVVIQFCDETTCNIGKTDANGVVSFDVPEGVVYEVHVLKVPEGYEKNSDEFRTLDVYSDLAIVVDKAA